MITGYIGRYMLYMALTAVIYMPCRILFLKKKRRKMQLWHEICLLLFWMFVIGIVSQTVFPRIHMGITDGGQFYIDAYYPPRSAPNFIPFKTLRLFLVNRSVTDWSSAALLNLLGNILLFIPIGLFFPVAFPAQKHFKYIFCYALGGIFTIEFLQYFCGRVADVDDVLLNMLGILLDYCIFLLCNKSSPL